MSVLYLVSIGHQNKQNYNHVQRQNSLKSSMYFDKFLIEVDLIFKFKLKFCTRSLGTRLSTVCC